MTRSLSDSFGLIAQLASTRITLPLTRVETRFRVTGDVALVEIDQVFVQNARRSLDVTYTFPLPDSAAVFRCEMVINDRLIVARVMEQQEARRQAAAHKAAGHRTALVEVERDNLFTLALGNTAPGDRIVIRFAYVETLDRLGDQLSLRIPLCPGIRYIPGRPLLRANRGPGVVDDTDLVPDASRISPPRITGDHPDAADWSLHGTVAADGVDFESLSSPSHPTVVRAGDGIIEVGLCGDAHLPDRDLVLRWRVVRPQHEPEAVVWVSHAAGQPADEPTDEQAHALLQLGAPPLAPATDDRQPGRDVYFLLDRSGSMAGRKWSQSVAALAAFVHELDPGDRVWITCFESGFQDFAEAPVPRDELLDREQWRSLEQMGVGGGTELAPALFHVMQQSRRHSAGRMACVIIITDGQVGYLSQTLLEGAPPNPDKLPIHTFGIDDAVNDTLLKDLARASGGRCTLMTPDDNIVAAVRQAAVMLRPPVLTEVRIEQEQDWQTPDGTSRLPDLHEGEVLRLPLAVTAAASRLTLRARLSDGRPWSAEVTLNAATGGIGDPLPRLLWARQHIRHLLAGNRQAEAVAVAVEHNLTCQGAAFMAWDPAEKVPVAADSVVQPSLTPTWAAASEDGLILAARQRVRDPGEQSVSACEDPPWWIEEYEQRKAFSVAESSVDYDTDRELQENERKSLCHRFSKILTEDLGWSAIAAEKAVKLLRGWMAKKPEVRHPLVSQWLLALVSAADPAAVLERLLADPKAGRGLKRLRQMLVGARAGAAPD